MRVFGTLRDRLRARRAVILNSEAIGPPSGGRVERLGASAAGRTVEYRARWVVLATAASRRAGSSSTRAGGAREGLGLPLADGRLGRGALHAALPSTTRSTRSASRSTTACAPSSLPPRGACTRTCSWLRRDACGARGRGRRSRATGSAWPPATAPRRSSWRRSGNDRRALRRHARLARPLRQVHDLRDRVPVLQRHAAVPRAEVRRPAGRALPHRRAGASTRRSTTSSSCGICTQVCLHGVHIAEINTRAKRLRERDGTPLREQLIARPTSSVVNARRADRQLDAAQPRVPAAPRRRPSTSTVTRRCRCSPGARSRPGRASPPRACGEAARRVLPRLRRELLRAAARRDDGRGARPQRSRSTCPSRTATAMLQSNGLFDDARRYVRRLVGSAGGRGDDGGDRRDVQAAR